mgnify:CR=1 FL=1
MIKNKNEIEFVRLGFCSNDYICLLPEIPIDHKVQILEHLIQGGGPAATATVAAARLGMKTAFLSMVGDDDPGRRILQDLEAENIFTGSMRVRQDSTSPIAYCWIDQPTGKRSIAWTRGTLRELDPSELDMERILNAKLLHLDGHNTAAAIVAAEEARKHGVLVSLDAGTIRPGVEKIMEHTDLLFTSEYFARTWTGEQDLEKALLKLVKIGAKVTGVTMGDKGSIAIDNGKIIHCPAFRVTPVDTTGAGDVFHGAFAVKYLESADLYESMRFASAVSAVKCRKLGGRAGIPTRRQVDEFLAEHQSQG